MPSLTDERGQDFQHPDPVTDQALEWALRLQANEADRHALNTWLSEGADRGEALARALALFDCPALAVASAQTLAEAEALNDERHRPPRPWWRPTRTVSMALAASLAAALVLPVLDIDWLIRFRADHRTAAGEIANIVLPDGSRMQMNSQTSVALDFKDGHRTVRLIEGEAFFEVVHDTDHPFMVTGGFGTVRVTGTAFNVAREDQEDVVYLESGHVLLSRANADADAKSMPLNPGETAAVDKASIALLPQTDSELRLAWREGWIQLSALPLRQALAEIGRHTDLRIVTLPGTNLDTPVSGSFRIAEAAAAINSVVTAAGATAQHLPGGILFIR